MEANDYHIEYEIKANPENDSSIDYKLDVNEYCCFFELLRVENNDEIDGHIEAQRKQDSLFESYERSLTAWWQAPSMTPEAIG